MSVLLSCESSRSVANEAEEKETKWKHASFS
jgi:hypothetical protein